MDIVGLVLVDFALFARYNQYKLLCCEMNTVKPELWQIRVFFLIFISLMLLFSPNFVHIVLQISYTTILLLFKFIGSIID